MFGGRFSTVVSEFSFKKKEYYSFLTSKHRNHDIYYRRVEEDNFSSFLTLFEGWDEKGRRMGREKERFPIGRKEEA